MVITLEKALEDKLNREFAKSKSNDTFLEDVCGVLMLSDWSDDTLRRLIKRPNLLKKVALALHEDDVFSDFFEQRVKALTLELMGK